jgi:MFS transporter, PPP family, 3-phenylpropionic acid transporter
MSATPQNLSARERARGLRLIFPLFFSMYLGAGVYWNFSSVYFKQVGMSGTQIGLIAMTSGLAAFLASPLWGYLSDRTGRPRMLLAVAAVGASSAALLMPVWRTFSSFVVLAGVFAFFNIAIMTLMDSSALALLGERRSEYGRYRLGGTFGYIFSTITAGFILEKIALDRLFILFAISYGIFLLFAIQLPQLPAIAKRAPGDERALSTMLRQPMWVLFIVATFIVWLAGSGGISFVSLTLKSMGASNSLVGIVAASAAVFEIPFMAYSGQILRRLGSARMVWFALLGYSARLFFYSVIPAPAWGIAVNVLNGVSYVSFWNAAIAYSYEAAPQEYKATSQGLFVAATALAAVAGSAVGGWLFDSLGPPGMYRIMASIAFASFVIFGLGRLKRPAPAVPSP